MVSGGRLFMLAQQLKSKSPKHCERCSLLYDPKQKNCPHCTGLTDMQVEELKESTKKVEHGNLVYLISVFFGLVFLFGLLSWICWD